MIRNLAVEPTITDPAIWQPEDIKTYRRLLNLDEGNTIYHETEAFTGPRKTCLDSIKQKEGDLFFDPDTGIATGRASRKHIKISVLGALLSTATESVRSEEIL
jgi:hypothetical protein